MDKLRKNSIREASWNPKNKKTAKFKTEIEIPLMKEPVPLVGLSL